MDICHLLLFVGCKWNYQHWGNRTAWKPNRAPFTWKPSTNSGWLFSKPEASWVHKSEVSLLDMAHFRSLFCLVFFLSVDAACIYQIIIVIISGLFWAVFRGILVTVVEIVKFITEVTLSLLSHIDTTMGDGYYLGISWLSLAISESEYWHWQCFKQTFLQHLGSRQSPMYSRMNSYIVRNS